MPEFQAYFTIPGAKYNLSTYISDSMPVQEVIRLKGLWGEKRGQRWVSSRGHPCFTQPSGKEEDGPRNVESCLLWEAGKPWVLENLTYRLQLVKVQELVVKALSEKAAC